MASQFFKNFPDVQYQIDGKVIFIKDFFRKSRVEQDSVNELINYNF